MFCQSCGAQNAIDARFCNMCGGGLSAPQGGATLRGSPPRPAPGPPLGHMLGPNDPGASSVSLQAIGVQSSARTWALIGGMVVVLLLLGGVGGWLTTRGGEAPVPVVPPDAIAAPMEIGTPTAVGEDLPSNDPPPQGMPPTAGAAKRAANARATSGTTGASGTAPAAGGNAARPSAARGTTPAAAARATGGSATTAGAARATGGSATTAAARVDSAGGSTGGGTAADPTAEAAGPDTVPADAPEEERDLLLDLYATQVRRFIRTYYATRAQSCFDHASRNNEGIRGTVVVTFTIAADGKIPTARATRNTTGDDALGGCLVNQVRAWDLPPPPGGELELAMPFSR